MANAILIYNTINTMSIIILIMSNGNNTIQCVCAINNVNINGLIIILMSNG